MGFWSESKENKEAKKHRREQIKEAQTDDRDVWTRSADARNSIGDHGAYPSESYMCNACWSVIGDNEDTITVRRKIYHLKCIK